jgi:hypothetical protein
MDYLVSATKGAPESYDDTVEQKLPVLWQAGVDNSDNCGIYVSKAW